jgi:hypothetical protein
MNIRQCRGNLLSRKHSFPYIVPVSQALFLAMGMLVPAPDQCGLGSAKESLRLPAFDPAHAAKRLRTLLRKGLITPHQFAIADALLWSCRAPGRDEAQISYHRLARLAGVGRSTAVEAVKRLRDLGVLSWRKTRLRVAWSLGVASRQWRNIYRLLAGPLTESSGQPTDRVQARKKDRIEAERVAPEVRQAAREALATIRQRRMRQLRLA